MSRAYRTITTIGIWVLFLVGLAALAMAFVRILLAAAGATRPPETELMTAYFGIGIAAVFLSVVAIRLSTKQG